MRPVVISLLTIFVVLGGCARKPEVTYVELPPTAPPVSAPEGTITLAAAGSGQGSAKSGAEPRSWNTRVAAAEASETQFDLIRAKADRVGVEHLTQADIEGLSFDEIQELRGY